ncbi:Por secretion system C-terminal sorting domain-containing protein [Dyadobacter sp. SG02]|uniref:T9SS type A sorting domain-containing protein n=1 Tax=Dyadobacter sp. SG02 TaxID=1855291 RepID=UPI0008BE5AFC|nr:T9SS type A sorting domain-containing protein [Dyadobacter sp. SG02]SEJ43599.1 Por secretion system C-terminal sorting domain-containing protein [Dyadobacter sp. SG02]
MKAVYILEWVLIVLLSASISLADPCTLSDELIELNSVTNSGGNCIINVKYSFTFDKNNGNKFAYIHFWLTSTYANPEYKKGPTKSELGPVLATVAINSDDPVSLLPTYAPDETVTPVFAGLSISQTDLGGGQFRITVDNIPLTVTGACALIPDITADVWATNSNDKATPPVHCLLKGNNTVLPVTLARFNGTLLDNAVSLSWATTEEAGSSHFDIERSADAQEFVQLGRIEARGNSSATLQYRFLDAKPLAGNNYYRLRMVDADGKFEYSRMIAIDNGPNSVAFELLGNPASGREIRFLLKNESAANVSLFDLSGKAVRFSLSQTGNEFTLKPKNSVSSGIYILKLQRNNAATISKKVLMP